MRYTQESVQYGYPLEKLGDHVEELLGILLSDGDEKELAA